MIEIIPKTPAEDVALRLAIPLKCGFKKCNVVFGIQPLPFIPGKMQEWKNILSSHFYAAHKRRRKLAYLTTGSKYDRLGLSNGSVKQLVVQRSVKP